MLYSHRVPLAAVVIAAAALACALPEIPIQDPSAISTAAAQTVIAALTQAVQSPGPTLSPSPGILSPTATSPLPSLTPSLTSTPETPTLTSTPSSTATPTLTFTPTLTLTLPYTTTPLVPLITVSVPTNCRTGPGIVYPRVGALLVGEVAQVIARNAQGNYWYIRNPDRPGGYCWLWGQYATVTGNISALPIYTPPPSPTPTFTATPSPSFDMEYAGLESCVGWWADFRIRNTGLVAFRSISITIRDAATGVVLAVSTNDFTDRDGCKSSTQDILRAGETLIVSSPELRYDPSGHRMRVTITLCSRVGQNGWCATKSMTFKP